MNNYNLIKENITLIEQFEVENKVFKRFSNDIDGFKKWIIEMDKVDSNIEQPQYEGKDNGRSLESVISTLLVHMNRYAKSYSKAAIYDSPFSTQEEFIYLINLKAFGEMSKMDLIKKNIQEKPVGIKIINRLINNGWVKQQNSSTDKRSKIIQITKSGLKILENQMAKIRQATNIVTGNLTNSEKIELIRLLKKLEDFHQPIFSKNIDSSELLLHVNSNHLINSNLN